MARRLARRALMVLGAIAAAVIAAILAMALPWAIIHDDRPYVENEITFAGGGG